MKMSFESIPISDELKEHVLDGTIDFTAGFLGGTALVYVGQPLDTIKVKMQTFPTLYKNMTDCFLKTLKTDGIVRGLYAGTVPALLANITENSVLFLSYGFCQKAVQQITDEENIEDLSILSNATAGCLAAFFSSLALCPTELIKCKLQAMYEVQKQEAARGLKVERVGPGQLFSKILRTEGFLGLFRGFVPTMAREMPGYFFFFGGYEGSRLLLALPEQAKEDIGLVKTMAAGSAGGILFWISTFPIDVAKSRIQVTNSSVGMFKTMADIVRHEGIRSLYTGLAPTLIRTVPATSTLFVTYEYSKKFMNYVFRDDEV